MSEQIEPKLAPPGAGLPAVELFVARILFGLRRKLGNYRSFHTRFEFERNQIRGLIRNVNSETGSRRVLIPRARGLEDSSRFWSVWMTLDHLQIVHYVFGKIITDLSNETVPIGKASTAAVKPNEASTSAVAELYEASCDSLEAAAAGSSNLNSRACFSHPWFGPLNAAGWYALAGGHLGIHRVQIERILAGLRNSSRD